MMHDASDDEAHALEREHSAGAVEVRGGAEQRLINVLDWAHAESDAPSVRGGGPLLWSLLPGGAVLPAGRRGPQLVHGWVG